MSSSKKRKTPNANTATHISSKSSHAATTAPPRERWRCDVCLVATFDSYDEAVIHENKCREKMTNDDMKQVECVVAAANSIMNEEREIQHTSNKVKPNPCDAADKEVKTSTSSAATTQISTNKTRTSSIDLLSAKTAAEDNNGIIATGHCSKSTTDSIIKEKEIQHTSKKVKPNPNNTADKKVKESTSSTATTTQKPTTTPNNNKRKTNWRCDVCLEAVFEDYDEAVAHEKQCTGGSKKKAKNSTENQQQEEDDIIEQGGFVHIKEHYIGNGAYIGGGIAQVTKVNVQLGTALSGYKKTYDVAYILGGNEEGVESCYITLAKGSPQKTEKDKTMPTSSPPKKKQVPTKKTPPKTNPSHILVKPVASRSPGIKLLSSTQTPEKSNGDDTTNNDSFEHSPSSPFEEDYTPVIMQQHKGVVLAPAPVIHGASGTSNSSPSKEIAPTTNDATQLKKPLPQPVHVPTQETTQDVSKQKKSPPEQKHNDVGDFSDMTVSQLKERLRDSNLAVSGRKQELVDRLNGHLGTSIVVEHAQDDNVTKEDNTSETKSISGIEQQEKESTESSQDDVDENDEQAEPKITSEGTKLHETTKTNEAQAPIRRSPISKARRTLLLLLIPVALYAYALLHLPERLLTMLFLPTTAPSITLLMMGLFCLCAVATFAFTIIITHESSHHHQSRGLLSDIGFVLTDLFWKPSMNVIEEEKIPLPTLREYLASEEGFHLAFAPAFFGFYAYFGSLAGIDEEMKGRCVPCSGSEVCGLKSVSGASAGAMAATMLASGIQPREAAEHVSTFTWKRVSDPPGMCAFVKGNKFEQAMRQFLLNANKIRQDTDDNETPIQLEEALVPVSVSGFDLMRMKGMNMTNGCMAKAARASAGFPVLFQPVPWRENDKEDKKKDKWLPDSLLIDGGITDSLGLNGIKALERTPKRVINMVVGDFGAQGPPRITDCIPKGVEIDSLVSLAIVGTPMCGPWAMQNGPIAVDSACKAMVAALDVPMERGPSGDNHYVVRVDASKYLQ